MAGKKSDDCIEDKPSFFKILCGKFDDKLRIPPLFVKHICKKTPRRATVEGPSGSIWRVELKKRSSTRTYLQNGWKRFVKDHSLHETDFLVFRYVGDMHFTVQIFDCSGCEREDAFSVIPSKITEAV